MTKLCPGQLPPGAAQAMAKQVKRWEESGLCSGVEIMAGPGCDAAEAKKGEVYRFDDYPSLPLAGCRREPCCACCYSPVLAEEKSGSIIVSGGMPLWKKALVAFSSLSITAVAASIFLSGCASHGVMVSDEQVKQFKRAETTEAQVLAALGQPTTVATVNGQRTLIYSGAYAQARPATFIPLVGPLVGGSDVRASSVVFRVVDGVVVEIISSQTATGGGTGFAAGAPVAPISDQPRR